MLWWFDTSGNSFRIANWNFLPRPASEHQHRSACWRWRHIVWNVVRWPGQNIQYPCQCQHPLNKNRQQETAAAPTSHHTNYAGASTSCKKVEKTLQRAVSAMTSFPLIVTPVSCPRPGSLSSVWVGTEIKGNRKNCSSNIHQSFLILTSVYIDIYNIYRMCLVENARLLWLFMI